MAAEWIAGKDVTYQSVRSRGIGFVFQHYALFARAIHKNIAFGLELRLTPKIRQRKNF